MNEWCKKLRKEERGLERQVAHGNYDIMWESANEHKANMPGDKDIQSTVLRLGAFHTEISFLGTIGHIMEGTARTGVGICPKRSTTYDERKGCLKSR